MWLHVLVFLPTCEASIYLLLQQSAFVKHWAQYSRLPGIIVPIQIAIHLGYRCIYLFLDRAYQGKQHLLMHNSHFWTSQFFGFLFPMICRCLSSLSTGVGKGSLSSWIAIICNSSDSVIMNQPRLLIVKSHVEPWYNGNAIP